MKAVAAALAVTGMVMTWTITLVCFIASANNRKPKTKFLCFDFYP
jgi:hypothetical protein